MTSVHFISRPMGDTLTFVIPGLKTVSEANRREHPLSVHRRRRKQAELVAGYLRCSRFPAPPLVVTFTRLIWRNRPMDTDNLAGAFKAVRDAVAKELGIDDGDPRVTWLYEQRKGGGEHGIEIRIAAAPPKAAGDGLAERLAEAEAVIEIAAVRYGIASARKYLEKYGRLPTSRGGL